MRIAVILCFIVLLAFGGEVVCAHHSFASFDMTKTVRISGTVSEVQYTNPHVWLFVDVAAANGGVETWAIEAGGLAASRTTISSPVLIPPRMPP